MLILFITLILVFQFFYFYWLTYFLLYVLFIISSFICLSYISTHQYSLTIIIILIFNIVFLLKHFYLNIFFNYYILYFGDFILFKFYKTTYGYLGFFLDKLNFSFAFLTIWIALFANIFSSVYIRSELIPERFIFFLNSFVISMILLLVSSNWLTLLLGWELIGVTSYLLINFWVNRNSTFKAAFKAFIFNKLSDVSLITSMIIYLNISNDFSFNLIYLNKHIFLTTIYPLHNFNLLFLFCLFVTTAAFCKSAQFGFHIWLPDSMEAPIPASALIHSATLVSAGIFILLKFWVLIKYSSLMYYFILYWSTFTALYGALVASVQTDLKKTLAFSTISHCGYIIFSIFLENNNITLLYLYSHGIFKAFSFMALGNIIYSYFGLQDLTRISNIFFFKKSNFLFLFFSLINLSSFPLSISFLIKHLLLNSFYNNYLFLGIYSLICFSSLIGLCYSLRLLLNLFFSFNKFYFIRFKSSFLNFSRLYKYNFVSIDIVISIFLFFGLLFSSLGLIILFNSFLQTNDFNIFFFYQVMFLKKSIYLILNFILLLTLLVFFVFYKNNFFKGKFFFDTNIVYVYSFVSLNFIV